MIVPQRVAALCSAVLAVAGCHASPPAKFGAARSGVEAWQTAEDAAHPAGSTGEAIRAAKALTELNLRNGETSGYKAHVCRVIDGAPRAPRVSLDMTQGPLQNTGRQLDIAIQGNGFFRVKTALDHGDGYAYTRFGNFFRNETGDLTAGMGVGYRVDPPINIPSNATAITISESGVVQMILPGQVAKQTIGQIQLYFFTNSERLHCTGGSLYEQTTAAGEAIELRPGESSAGTLQQGFLESSNVDVVREGQRIKFLDTWAAAIGE